LTRRAAPPDPVAGAGSEGGPRPPAGRNDE
jgi:hypothetical protein